MPTSRRIDGSQAHGRSLRRRDVYPDPVVDGEEYSDGLPSRLAAWVRELLTSDVERLEAELSGRLAAAAPTRTHHIAVVSPKGGVGQTTSTLLIGNALATFPRLRVLAADANRDFGTLASLVPDAVRSEGSLADLLEDLPEIDSATALRPYVSRLPSGLHILAAPTDPRAMAQTSTDSCWPSSVAITTSSCSTSAPESSIPAPSSASSAPTRRSWLRRPSTSPSRRCSTRCAIWATTTADAT